MVNYPVNIGGSIPSNSPISSNNTQGVKPSCMSATTSEVSQTTQKSTCSSCQAKAAMNASTPTTSSKHSQFFGIDINKSLVVGLLLGMIFAAVLHMKIEIGNG